MLEPVVLHMPEACLREADAVIGLSLPTSTNRIHAKGAKGGRVFKSADYAQWLDDAGWEVNRARAAGHVSRNLKTGYWWSEWRWPVDGKVDTDNHLKAGHDLLVKMAVVSDDRWRWGGKDQRFKGIATGRCEVRLWALGTCMEDIRHA